MTWKAPLLPGAARSPPARLVPNRKVERRIDPETAGRNVNRVLARSQRREHQIVPLARRFAGALAGARDAENIVRSDRKWKVRRQHVIIGKVLKLGVVEGHAQRSHTADEGCRAAGPLGRSLAVERWLF